MQQEKSNAGGCSVSWGCPCTHIFVFHVLEQPQLPVGSLGVDDGLEGPRQLLHRHPQTCLGVKGRTATQSRKIIPLTPGNAFKPTLILHTELQQHRFSSERDF